MRVRRTKIEAVLLNHIQGELLSEEAYQFYVAEIRRLSKAKKSDSSQLEKQLKQCLKEIKNLMTAIKAGIITSSTKSSLEAAEQQKLELERQIKAIKTAPETMITQLREVYQRMVASLSKMEYTKPARQVVEELLGDIVLTPNWQGNFLHAKTTKGGLAATFAETLVAGADLNRRPSGYEPDGLPDCPIPRQTVELLNFSFFINNVFSCYWIKFFDFKFTRHVLFVFISSIKMTSTS